MIDATHNAAVELTARAKAFSREGIQDNRFLVETDNTVRVWDAVAGYYTTFHSLSDSAMRRIRRLAAEAVRGAK